MLFKKKQYVGSQSLSAHAWRKFRKNILAFSALILIILVAFIAILGYLVTPDSSPMANDQHLEIARQKPGFKVEMLKMKRAAEARHGNFLKTMIYGKVPAYRFLPISGWNLKNDTLYYKEFSSHPLSDTARFPVNRSALAEHNWEDNIVTKTFILGTDNYGRDMLSRLMIGARVSLSVGLISVIISLIIGITLGSIAGFFRGRLDHFIVWLINVVWSIPTLLLVIAITFALGKGFWQVFVAVGLTMWVEVARVVRGQIMSIREKEFVEAGKALGYKNFRIIFRHILPNIMGPVIVISAANFASAILIEAGLSFLGIGVQPPMPSWGTMIKENYAYIILDAAYLAILPGLAIMLMVLAFMIIGNGLRDALDVKRS
jgi:peptide/nickel transport system permease protein